MTLDQTTFAANLAATPILDHTSAPITELARQLRASASSDRDLMRSAHRHLMSAIRPVYTLDEMQPASTTLAKGVGSCSQRMACLEAVARAAGIPTRVRGLHVDGRFWYPRFKLTRPFIPANILLAWPQFHLDGEWVDFDELHASMSELVTTAPGYTNAGETLFDAVEHAPVDFMGKSRDCGSFCAPASIDLSRFIRSDNGFFDTRDKLFERFGLMSRSIRGRAFEIIYGGKSSAVEDGGRRTEDGGKEKRK